MAFCLLRWTCLPWISIYPSTSHKRNVTQGTRMSLRPSQTHPQDNLICKACRPHIQSDRHCYIIAECRQDTPGGLGTSDESPWAGPFAGGKEQSTVQQWYSCQTIRPASPAYTTWCYNSWLLLLTALPA